MSDLYVDKFINTRIILRFNTQTFKICLLYNFYIFIFMFLFMSLFTILFALSHCCLYHFLHYYSCDCLSLYLRDVSVISIQSTQSIYQSITQQLTEALAQMMP